jgi:ribosomal protein L16/L10AE
MIKLRIPNRTKFKKYNRQYCYKYMHVKSPTTANPRGYIYTIRAQESAFLPISLIETCFKALSKSIKIKSRRKKKSRIRGFYNIDKPVSGKSVGVRMGKGKGAIRHWGCPIRKGQLLFTIRKKVRPKAAINGLKQVSIRLPILTNKKSLRKLSKPSFLKNKKNQYY